MVRRPEGDSWHWTCNTVEPGTTDLEAATEELDEVEPMGHPYRQRHTDVASTTSDKLAGTTKKQTAPAKTKGKRSSK